MCLSWVEPCHGDTGTASGGQWPAWLAVALLAERGMATSDREQPRGQEPCCRAGRLKLDIQLGPA